MDDINVSNILHDRIQERVCVEISQYFQNRSPLVKTFKYFSPLLGEDDVRSPPSCDCASSLLRYESCGHVITAGFSIIPYEGLKQLLLKDLNYTEQKSMNWGYSIKLIFIVIEEYAKMGEERK